MVSHSRFDLRMVRLHFFFFVLFLINDSHILWALKFNKRIYVATVIKYKRAINQNWLLFVAALTIIFWWYMNGLIDGRFTSLQIFIAYNKT